MVAISIIILVICGLLALVVLAQNPKGGGLAAGFTGAQQIGGVQRTADFLEKGTWTLATALMVLCLVSAGLQDRGSNVVLQDELDAATENVDAPAAGDGAMEEGGESVPPSKGQAPTE
ncbi:MAG: preprotein translocase subunit SecG [Flavobacteriales bacterium]